MAKRKTKKHEVANAICSSGSFSRNLAYHKEYNLFYFYDVEGYYRLLDPHEMNSIVLKYVESTFGDELDIDVDFILKIVNLMRYKTQRTMENEDLSLITFKDVLYNTKTFKTEEKSRDKVSVLYLPYNYEETEEHTPVFDRFLKEILVKEDNVNEHDPQLALLVQEMFGMIFLDNLKASMAFFLLGTLGANGKSTLLTCLQKILTEQFFCSLSISDLSDKFSTHKIIGKLVNISGEEDDKYVTGKMFKALVSGDYVKGERKFGESFNFKPKTKYIFSTNRMPTFDGMDGGIRRRLKIIPFYRRFSGAEMDPHLEEKLEKELAGIVGWALKGAKRLVENNYIFSDSPQIHKVMAEFEDKMASPVRFIREEYEIDDNYMVLYKELYAHYKNWCIENGYKPKGKYQFLEDIRGNITDVKENRTMVGCGFNVIRKGSLDKEIKQSFENYEQNRETFEAGDLLGQIDFSR